MVMRSLSSLPGAFDPASRARIRIFSLKLLVLTLFSSILAMRYRYPPFALIASCAFWCGAFAGLIAAFRREPLVGSSLNRWDELLAFLAINTLARFLGSAVG